MPTKKRAEAEKTKSGGAKAEAIERGTLVRLRSGGPVMTAGGAVMTARGGERPRPGDQLLCHWFDGHAPRSAVFHADCLVRYGSQDDARASHDPPPSQCGDIRPGDIRPAI